MRALEGRVAKPGPRPIGLALLGLLAAGALLFWPNLGPLAARGSPRTVTILYTGYTQGRVDAKSVCA